MKVAVPVTSNKEPYIISSHFGRSRYFALVEIKEGGYEVEVLENPAFKERGAGMREHGGHGRTAVSFVGSLGVEAVIVKSIGYGAFYNLKDLGIKVYESSDRYLRDAIDKFRRGELRERERLSEHHD